MTMLHALFSRVLSLFLVLCVCFFALETLPGDACTAFLDQDARDPELLQICRANLGIDQPILVRFGEWAEALMRGDLGTSLTRDRPVSEVIAPELRNTFLLALVSAIASVPLSIILGIIAATRPGSRLDMTLSAVFLIAMTLPEFIIATCMIFLFAISLQWFPAVTIVPTGAPVLDMLPNIVLPVVTLSLVMVAHTMQVVRSRVIGILESDFIEACWLRGFSYWRILFGHALPSALPPALNVIALSLASLLGGVVVIERVFNYPGLGTLTLQAIHDRDMPLVQGVVVVFTLTYTGLSLLADTISTLLDPRAGANNHA
ncbi:ABC transporter permease [Mesorhizobium tianshanense]|uniref:Peptide/nickel transport system permease protein n=1 Tax=Mesorhizobium tianshanense TaxID=39844 RepID=A0A562NLV5_9HYPH|nr:ABC transporter permease [Mesorhizobium tianshanense]TWI33148.1 peptide/nickel transport system permease protein [Mesorhizobium tianshanense]GLS34981.1 ABC transporter permease [Mesorhizobium tianshanense]